MLVFRKKKEERKKKERRKKEERKKKERRMKREREKGKEFVGCVGFVMFFFLLFFFSFVPNRVSSFPFFYFVF